MPNFSLTLQHEKESREERKRKVEAETTQKPPKRQRKLGNRPEKQSEDKAADDNTADDQIELPGSLVKRLETSNAKFEDQLLTFSATLMEADAPDMAGHSPANIRQKAGDLIQEANNTGKEMSKFLESKKGSKSTATELLKTAKAQQQNMKEINSRLREFLKEAAAENA